MNFTVELYQVLINVVIRVLREALHLDFTVVPSHPLYREIVESAFSLHLFQDERI
tara:strand:+ start:172 stop:336 length:165 start_codon:yes stop_codon:yes gene_type:complete